jgi:hypothetical protein
VDYSNKSTRLQHCNKNYKWKEFCSEGQWKGREDIQTNFLSWFWWKKCLAPKAQWSNWSLKSKIIQILYLYFYKFLIEKLSLSYIQFVLAFNVMHYFFKFPTVLFTNFAAEINLSCSKGTVVKMLPSEAKQYKFYIFIFTNFLIEKLSISYVQFVLALNIYHYLLNIPPSYLQILQLR